MPPTAPDLSNLLGLLYDAASDPALWHPFIEKFAQTSRATSAALVVHNFENPTCTVASSCSLDPDLQKLYEERYHHVDLWAQRGLTRPEGSIFTSQDLCPLPELKNTEIYNDLYVASQIEHAAFAVLRRDETCLAGFSLYRGRRGPEFTASDLQLLRVLTPHLQRAFKLHFQLADLKARADSLQSALDASATPTLLLGARGGIVYMNQCSATLLAEKDGLLISANALLAERLPESELLQAAIRSAASKSPDQADLPGGALFISRRSRPALQVFVAPIRAVVSGGPGPASVAVFVTDPLRVQRPTLDILRARYGLTPAEGRVALLLADGHSPKQISAILAVTEHTIRSQIKAIFAKTGVRRQSELVRLLLTDTGPRL